MKTVKIRGEDAPPCITPVRKVMIAHLGVGESRVGGADTANPAPNARRTRTRTRWARRRDDDRPFIVLTETKFVCRLSRALGGSPAQRRAVRLCLQSRLLRACWWTLRGMPGERVRGRAQHVGVHGLSREFRFSDSPAGSDAQTDCLCSLGFYGAPGGPCAGSRLCMARFFKGSSDG